MSKTRYTLVSKTGSEMYSANSFLGFIGLIFLHTIFTMIGFILLAAIVCGIGSIFS